MVQASAVLAQHTNIVLLYFWSAGQTMTVLMSYIIDKLFKLDQSAKSSQSVGLHIHTVVTKETRNA